MESNGYVKKAADASRIRKLARHTATVVAICLLLAAGICTVSYQRDCRVLSVLAHNLSADAKTPSETVINLMDWVYHDLGTRRNENQFLFSSYNRRGWKFSFNLPVGSAHQFLVGLAIFP